MRRHPPDLSYKDRLEVVNTSSSAAGRATFEPGAPWHKHVNPIAASESNQAATHGLRQALVVDPSATSLATLFARPRRDSAGPGLVVRNEEVEA
jgi:hypothetical protein